MNEEIRFEWNIGNTCNLDCSYCHRELKDGRNPFPELEVLLPAFDHLLDQTRDFLSVKIEITGGEPSQSFALRTAISKLADNRVKFKLISNATASVDWWSEIKHKLYAVQLSYHPTENFAHFVSVARQLQHTDLSIKVPILPDNWTGQKQIYNQLLSMNFRVDLQLLYSNFTRGNSIYFKYSEDQWQEYYKIKGVDVSKKEEVVKTIEFKKANNLNNFYGKLCWAGHEQAVIDNFGDVWRGWCKSDQCLGNIYKKTFKLDTTPRVCPRQLCKNGFDLQARKSENSWGIA